MPIPLCTQYAWEIFTRSTRQCAILTAEKNTGSPRGAFINIYAKTGICPTQRPAPTFLSCEGV